MRLVAGEIVQYGLVTLTPGGAVNDPALGPCWRGQHKIGTARGQRGLELAADELGQGRLWNQIALAGGEPIPPVVRYTATCH